LLTAAIALAAVLFMTALLLARNRQLILSRQKTERISKSLAESERQLNQAQAIAHIGSWNLDIVADKLTWSEEIYRMFGLPIDAPQKLETFLALIHPDDREYVGKAWSDTVKNNAIYDIEHRILINDQVRWVRERAEISRDYKGVALSSLGTIQDITEKKRTEAMIWHEANFDRLTDLPNRALLFNRISTSLAAAYRHNKIVALFCADLDGFKAVNDVHGHKAGDHVLAAVAKRWRVRVRETDTVARIGGDEFAILLPDIGQLEVAEHIANKMIAALQEPIVLPDGESVQIGASIGVSLFPNNAGEIDSMMAAADEAMYRSKARGKNCYVLSERRHDMLGSQGEWIKMNDDHLLGIEVIDEQHRKLVDITNNINRAIQRNADRDELDLLMGELVSFARIHFDTEEDLMQGQGYPEIEEHKREHGWLLNKLQFLSSGGGEGHEMEILQTLKDWLFRHIDIEDKKFAAMGKATHHSAIQQSRQCDSTQSL
jgi:diguanylate cyclase (GGDEF)-like protein/hemerythrin-like metal-binding protein/PAS domain S-box-containing protein